MNRRKIIFTIILFLAVEVTFAQQSAKSMLTSIIEIEDSKIKIPHTHDFSHYMDQCSNEAETIITSFFIFYKNYVSSQDSRSCTFEPSCSVYSIETIRKNGAIIGFLDTIDRLTRCNGLSPEYYHIDNETHLLIDQP